MKKVLSLGVVTALALGALTGCSMESSSGSDKKDSKDKKRPYYWGIYNNNATPILH